MSARDLIAGEAELGSESDDESYDEDTGEARRKTNGTNGHLDDSSEEEEDDDDEEAARAVREGFIVEEDEDEEEERSRRRKERKKRRREEREEEEAGLDEEDLDLIGETNPEFIRKPQEEPKLKRLKRGHREDRVEGRPRGVDDIFNSDEEEEELSREDERRQARGRVMEDEFADFIEQDFSGDEGQERNQEDAEVARTVRRGYTGLQDTSGLDEAALEDMKEAFGDGMEYDWALQLQEQEEDERVGRDGGEEGGLSKAIELKDVFEPSQLAERMLTDEDNEIRAIDEPERFQIARKPYKNLFLTDEQFKEEGLWISNLMWQRKQLDSNLEEPFQRSVAKVLEFMVSEDFEVPFIFQHRKDYLIHAAKVAVTPDPSNPNASQYVVSAEKLLNQSDLWDIFENDLKFRALIEKRNALQKTYDNLVSTTNSKDTVFEEMLPLATTMEELQDVQDYLYFQHSARLADLQIVNGTATNGTQRRPGAKRSIFDRVRHGKVYNLVRAFGITADAFATNASKREGRRQYTEDPAENPDDMANSEDVLDPPEYSSGPQCLRSAKAMFAEEICLSPRMRQVMREAYYTTGVIDCIRTDKGLKKIDEHHVYYEFKYLRNQELQQIARRPDLFLKMLRAEEEGLVEVKVRLRNYDRFKKSLYKDIESDNFSEVAEAWNKQRREALDLALFKLDKIMGRGLKDNLKSECEDQVAKACRDEFSKKLDQAPYKPKGMMLGTVPRVLALSSGSGTYGRDAICWAWVEEDGRVLENGKYTDLSSGDSERGTADGVDVKKFVELVNRRRPDVIGVSGFSADTRKLYKQLEQLVDTHDLRGGEYEGEDGQELSDKLEVVIVNDEVARLYQSSDRANHEHPGFAPLTKYCVALAKYLQNPLKEYASLGRDITSIAFDSAQGYVSAEKILKQLETALVDMVNLCGVDVNEAISDMYTANLLPYVCGLGPRKAGQLLKAININGGVVQTRAELVGDAEQRKVPAVGPRVWNNCASFLWIEFDSSEPESDYLDNTRVHPQDYDLGRKMAADALELDEEDIQAEQQENGPGATVRKLIKDESQEKVNDLILEEYAEQLEKNFNQRKRATLETIRAELQQPYEELRRNFALLSTDEIFTMFTGETRDSLQEGMIVPMAIRRVSDDAIEGKLDCGVECQVQGGDIADRLDVSAKQLFTPHQTVQGKIKTLNRKYLTANISLSESDMRRPFRRDFDRLPEEWDDRQEGEDRNALAEKNDVSGRTQRVIKHPMFRPFNSAQAEEYLGSQARGDVVIRPSSKGLDHLAVTWKVANGVYQHIDVLELDKENEFSLGRTLKIAGRWTYSDLDELIVNHVKAMGKKVDELMLHDKFKEGTRAEADRWLTTYTEANPKRSSYVFCIDNKHPGCFHLCFKAGQNAPVQAWWVKIIPGAYELQKVQYQDMRALCNGFKVLFTNMLKLKRR
ncbi:Transcription elongation factor spt6 [Agyrium rufum]|nr:Transcription elongation factor spt6 [Agyrium rufum]